MKLPDTMDYTAVGDVRFQLREQSWFAQVELRHKHTGKVARVTVRRNAYDAQSYKKIELFDLGAGCWHQVFYAQLAEKDSCYKISYTKESLGTPDKLTFVDDIYRYLTLLTALLGAAS